MKLTKLPAQGLPPLWNQRYWYGGTLQSSQIIRVRVNLQQMQKCTGDWRSQLPIPDNSQVHQPKHRPVQQAGTKV